MNEREIFEQAIEIRDHQQRDAFLDQVCGDDDALRQRLERLLDSHDQASGFLRVPAVNPMAPDVSSHHLTIEHSLSSGATQADSESDAREDHDDEAASETDLSFLQSSTKRGSIGRLGHYEILQILGQGAFGIVFKAFDEKLHRHVAVKAMSPQLAMTSPPRKRFLREARSVAAIKHENIVQVHAVEEQPLPYLVMEFVDGQTLAQKLDTAGPLDLMEILHLGRQMAAGLAAAHDKGLIHRDIKPGNILLEAGAEQKVKITDFGLARAADDATMTRTGTIAGTPMFMSPEQAMGQTLDHRSDLFSLGSVLYQMASGRPPFRGANAIAVLKRVVDEAPRPIQDILPEVPDWLCSIIEKLHAKKPAERYQTAKEVVDLLARCQNELQINGQVTCVGAPQSNTVAAPAPASAHGGTPKAPDAVAVAPSPQATRAASQATGARERTAEPAESVASRRAFPLVGAVTLGLALAVVAATEYTGVTHWFGQPANQASSSASREEASQQDVEEASTSAGGSRTASATNSEPANRSPSNPPAPSESNSVTSVSPAVESPAPLVPLAPVDFDAERRSAENLLALKGKIREINLHRPDGVPLIAVSPVNPQLPNYPFLVSTFGQTGSAKLTDDDLQIIGSCAWLTSLELAENDQLTDRGFSALANLRHLRRLRFRNVPIADASFTAILKANPELETLDLWGTQVTEAGLSALQHCPRLKVVHLPSAAGTDKLCELLVAHCRELRAFYVHEPHGVNPSALVGLPLLREVHLSGEGLKDGRYEANIAALEQLPLFDTLQVDPPMNDDLLAKLKPVAPRIRQLKVVSFYDWDPGVTAQGWQVLEAFSNLEDLEIGGVKSALDASTLERLATLPKLRRLVLGFLSPENRQYTDADLAAFRQKRPDVAFTVRNETGSKSYPRLDLYPVAADGRSLAAWELPAAAPPPAVAPLSAEQAHQHQAAWAKFLGQDLEFTNSIGMKFRLIPPGEAVVPIPGGPRLELKRSPTPYYLASTEVTVGQFMKFVEATGYVTEAERWKSGRNMSFMTDPQINWRTPGYPLSDDLPVNVVSPADAEAFCAWLNATENGEQRYRLPQGFEWEFATFAGSDGDFGFAGASEAMHDYAWIAANSNEDSAIVQPVGGKRANPFGLFDVIGNVWEWTMDDVAGVVNGVRGASYRDPIIPIRSWVPGTIHVQPNVGFRVLRQLEPFVPRKFADQPLLTARHAPLGPQTAVSRPTPITGVRSWTVELAAHQFNVTSIAWSPKGDTIATASTDMSVRLWDRDGQLKSILLGSAGNIMHPHSLSFSPDGTKLAHVSSSTDPERPSSLHVWDLATGRCYPLRQISNSWAGGVSWSPDGTQFAYEHENAWHIVDLETGRVRRTIRRENGVATRLTWSPDGKSVCVPANTRLSLLDAASGQEIGTFPLNDSDTSAPSISDVAWSADGRWLAAAKGKTIYLWDAETRQLARSVPTQYPVFWLLAWHPNSQRLAIFGDGGSDTPQMIVDPASGQVVTEFSLPSRTGGIAWSPDGAEFASHTGTVLQFHDGQTAQVLRTGSPRGLMFNNLQSSVSLDGERVHVKAFDVPERLEFDADSGRLLARLPAPPGFLLARASNARWWAFHGYSEDPQVVIASSSGTQKPLTFPTPGLSFVWRSDPASERLAQAFDTQVRVWDATTGELKRTLDHPAKVWTFEWSPDGRQIATLGEDKTIRVWDVRSGKATAEPKQLPPEVTIGSTPRGAPLLAWTHDGRGLWIPLGFSISLLDLATGQMSNVERYSNGNVVESLTLAPDGDRLLVREAYGWTFLRDRDGLSSLLGQNLGTRPQWHPDAKRFLSGSEEPGTGIRGFEVSQRQRLGTLWPALFAGNNWSGWLCVGPTGHYRGSDGVEQQIAYVAQLDDGSHVTLPPAEFAARFGWKNDPEKATLLQMSP